MRILAPPTAQPFLHWGDPLRILVSYSESARDAGIEGMRLWAHVVRIAVDHEGYRLHAAFSRGGTDGDWDKLSSWIEKLAGFELPASRSGKASVELPASRSRKR
jgi:hypothetical protein